MKFGGSNSPEWEKAELDGKIETLVLNEPFQ